MENDRRIERIEMAIRIMLNDPALGGSPTFAALTKDRVLKLIDSDEAKAHETFIAELQRVAEGWPR